MFKVNIGTISSNYYTAVEGTTITLSNTPDSGYSLSYYTVNGTPIQGNTFVLTGNVIVSAVFTNQQTFSISVSDVPNCTITLSQYTGSYGDTITISSTTTTDYAVDYYTVNGNQIVGNTFTLTGDTTVSASVSWNPNYVEVNGKKWMMTELAYDDGMGGIYTKDNLYTSSTGVQQPYFGTKYYYTWSAAKRVADKIDGWHLPTSSEWLDLIYYASGTSVPQTAIWPLTTMDETTTNKLKSSSSWNGNNELGLNFLPLSIYDQIVQHTSSGWCVTPGGSQDQGYYWCADGTINDQCCVAMSSRNGGQGFYWNIMAGAECPVRLIKDS